jgi:hypothetical protein
MASSRMIEGRFNFSAGVWNEGRQHEIARWNSMTGKAVA